MKKSILQNLKKYIITLFLLIVTLFGVTAVRPVDYHAYATDVNTFDKTNPLVDLKKEPSFDERLYPYNSFGELEVVSFVEYCYAFDKANNGNYGIYLYIYNPQALTFLDSTQNKIQLSVGYDEQGRPNNYEKFMLKLCSFSTDDNLRKFYKFKVVDHPIADGTYIYDRLNKDNRRYDVSGVELITEEGVLAGNFNAKDYAIEKTYYYTGYSKGYGENANEESTLTCEYDVLETVKLKLNHTFWRSKTSNLGVGYQNQIDTVYFSVPNEFLRKYGKLQQIKAEWYEYKTKDIVVLYNQEIYDNIYPHRGQSSKPSKDYYLLEGFNVTNGATVDIRSATWAYNPNMRDTFGETILGQGIDHCDVTADKLYYIFPPGIFNSGNYDPYATLSETAQNALVEYIYEYDVTPRTEKIKSGLISPDLFEDDIDERRKRNDAYGKIQKGYSYYEFDADVHIFDLLSYEPTDHKFTENVQMYGFFKTFFKDFEVIEEDYTNLSPILPIDAKDLEGNEQEISAKLCVNSNHVEKLKTTQAEAEANDETVFLFRCAVSDYYSAELINLDKIGMRETVGYRAKQSVLLDLDVIQLKFKNEDNVLTVLPVVASPIDVINPVTPPFSFADDGFSKLILIAIIVVIVLILIGVIGIYFPGIWKIIGAIFKYLGLGIYWFFAWPFKVAKCVKNKKKAKASQTNEKEIKQ